MSDTPASTPETPNPQASTSNKGIGCLGIIILLCVIGWIADMAGCNSTTTQDSGSKQMSKAQWREKVRPYWNPGGGIKVTTIANFKALMGEPSSTQTADGIADWYYTCSDGTIQLELVDPGMSGGQLLIRAINDF
jgi:hypothetical protein